MLIFTCLFLDSCLDSAKNAGMGSSWVVSANFVKGTPSVITVQKKMTGTAESALIVNLTNHWTVNRVLLCLTGTVAVATI